MTTPILYHGSSNKFHGFDYKKIGERGTTEGFGFYFTDSIEVAKQYSNQGFIYVAEFHGKKMLSSEKVTITRQELRKLLARLHETGDFLSNYGDIPYDGYEKVMRTAIKNLLDWSDDDMDVVGAIVNSYGGVEPVLKELYNTLGYDHTIAEPDWTQGKSKVYVAFVEDAVKVVDILSHSIC